MYRLEDINNIKQNLSNIQDEAHYIFKTTYEPTLNEYKEVMKLILEFIKKKKRIIYGGYAQNQLIKVKNENDIFYKEIDTPDIEFYSYEPIKDVIELCDFLYVNKCKHIQGAEGVHEGTYKIFVNFENYCDITYMPKNICDSIKYIELDNNRFAHPYFMYIDYYRIFTDPFSFSFRLDKSFNRYLKLYKHYPIEKPNNMNINIIKSDNNIIEFIRKKIIHNSKYIVIGKYALNYYLKKMGENLIDIDFYEIITLNYNDDIQKINKYLKSQYANKLTTKEFSPFFEFFGKRIEFYVNNKLVLKVYDNNNRCIVHRFSEKKKCYFGTNQLLLLFLLSNYNYSLINRNKIDENNNLVMINKLITTKMNYLEKNEKTVLDKTPFEDFIINCNGIILDPRRNAFLERSKKHKKGLRIIFKYEPSEKKITIPNHLFTNISGNEIINNKNLSLKN